jgi:hypothetical protein
MHCRAWAVVCHLNLLCIAFVLQYICIVLLFARVSHDGICICIVRVVHVSFSMCNFVLSHLWAMPY